MFSFEAVVIKAHESLLTAEYQAINCAASMINYFRKFWLKCGGKEPDAEDTVVLAFSSDRESIYATLHWHKVQGFGKNREVCYHSRAILSGILNEEEDVFRMRGIMKAMRKFILGTRLPRMHLALEAYRTVNIQASETVTPA
ncbi:hypothetical protein EJ08DRAFT_648927 [Tothia fuscella]|uniref:Uncharacterized protein n=1 Tax=Tothia fuscella TaxID=1048955 RepID=A0A9P4NTJ4_9PEZI|nr:hypothetical protein EJ08DRAFT_648927 [Tothia fuscella]